MKPLTFPLAALAALTFLPADTARAAGADIPQVAEIVTFKLVGSADETAFLTAAAGMTPFLESTGAVITRRLSKGDDGLWTDHIVWTSLAQAQAAAEAMMQRPEAAPFMALIDPDTVMMRHEMILFQAE